MRSLEFIFLATALHCVLSNSKVIYNTLTPEEVARIHSWTPDDPEPMWQLSGQFEGDILLLANTRNGLADTVKRWPKRTIPYKFSNHFNKSERAFIVSKIKDMFKRTCLKIRPRANQTDYVYITGKEEGCNSALGRIGGKQPMNLYKNGCLTAGIIAHEFLHAAGFVHQHSTLDRDEYVEIIWENIRKDKINNFRKYRRGNLTSFGEPYDYGSIMHYSRKAFRINDGDTIVPKVKNVTIGQRNKLSPIDIRKLNKMYKCKEN